MSTSTTPRDRSSAAIWLAGTLIWLPAIALLALRTILPWDGAWVSVVTTRPDQVTVVKAAPDTALRANDVIVAVAGRTVSDLLRETMSAPWQANRILRHAPEMTYLVHRDGREIALPVTWQPGRIGLGFQRWGILLFGLVFQAVGVFLLLKQPRDPVVRVIFLTAACMLSYSILRAANLRVSEILFGPSWSLYLLLGVAVNLGWQVGLVWLSLVFPRPHPWLLTRRSTLFTLLAVLSAVVLLPVLMTVRLTQNPVRMLPGVTALLLLVQLTLFILAVFFFVTNYRSLGADDRRRAKWVIMAFSTALIMGLFLSVLPDIVARRARWANLPLQETALRNNLIWVAALGIPASFAIAIRRHRLFDVDLVINRALVWGALTALTMGIYVLIVGGLSALFHASNSPLAFFLAAGVVAVIFQPARQRLQRAVNRLMYGERDDPYAVLSRLGQRLGGALAPDAVAPAIVESIAVALKLPYVALTTEVRNHNSQPGLEALAGLAEPRTQPAHPEGGLRKASIREDGLRNDFIRSEAPLAAWGRPPTYPVIRLPLLHQGQPVGELILAPRSAGEPFSILDRRLLDDLAKQAGVALYAAQQTWQAQQLAVDLQHSRERLVAAREEERRRLRRDLHDGLGPALASLTLKVDATRDELDYDTRSASEMLEGLKGDIQAAISDIRRLVYDLRPPALDDLGLAASLRLLAERYQNPDLTLTCDLPERLPTLPAAVEVAIYRITAEALTNVVRHASARICRVRLTVADRVELTISDDGRGASPDVTAGVGWVSMRERAAELGGECAITTGAGGGTTVQVWLPLP